MPENEEKLQRLAGILDPTNTLTKRDFLAQFERVIKIILQKQEELRAALQRFDDISNATFKKLGDDNTKGLADLKGQVNELFVGKQLAGMNENIRNKLSEVDMRMMSVRSGIDGKDGYTPVKGKDYFDGKDGSPDTGEQIKTKLEALRGDERLDRSAIKGIEEMEKDLQERARRGRVVSTPHNLLQVQDLSASTNGSTKTFSVPTHRHALMVTCTQFPFFYRPTVDFTTNGRQITLTGQVEAPATGQSLFFWYIK